jgi:toxin FitB
LSFLLDTNVVSEIRKGTRAHPAVWRWFVATPETELFLSVIVLGELRRGAEHAEKRDPLKARRLRIWLASLELHFGARVLPIGREADIWGRMNAVRTLPPVDSMLAATAKARGMVFVTRNVRDVADTGVDLLDPFARLQA